MAKLLKYYEEFVRERDRMARRDKVYPGLSFTYMMDQYGVKGAVDRILVKQPAGYVHPALAHLRMVEKIEYSVEGWVIHDAFRRLFTREQLLEAENRLLRLGVSWDRFLLPNKPVQLIFVYHQTR